MRTTELRTPANRTSSTSSTISSVNQTRWESSTSSLSSSMRSGRMTPSAVSRDTGVYSTKSEPLSSSLIINADHLPLVKPSRASPSLTARSKTCTPPLYSGSRFIVYPGLLRCYETFFILCASTVENCFPCTLSPSILTTGYEVFTPSSFPYPLKTLDLHITPSPLAHSNLFNLLLTRY